MVAPLIIALILASLGACLLGRRGYALINVPAKSLWDKRKLCRFIGFMLLAIAANLLVQACNERFAWGIPLFAIVGLHLVLVLAIPMVIEIAPHRWRAQQCRQDDDIVDE